MDLNVARSNYQGDVFFYRARDLIDRLYEENDQEIYDSFFDEGHPTEGDWDTLVWYLDVEIASKPEQSVIYIVDVESSSDLIESIIFCF